MRMMLVGAGAVGESILKVMQWRDPKGEWLKYVLVCDYDLKRAEKNRCTKKIVHLFSLSFYQLVLASQVVLSLHTLQRFVRSPSFLPVSFHERKMLPYALLLRPLAVSRASLIRHILDKFKFTLFYLSGQIFYFFPPKIAPIKRT